MQESAESIDVQGLNKGKEQHAEDAWHAIQAEDWRRIDFRRHEKEETFFLSMNLEQKTATARSQNLKDEDRTNSGQTASTRNR